MLLRSTQNTYFLLATRIVLIYKGKWILRFNAKGLDFMGCVLVVVVVVVVLVMVFPLGVPADL